MGKVEYLRKVLLEEYGIANDRELEEALRKMPKINIGIFTTRIDRNCEKGERKGA